MAERVETIRLTAVVNNYLTGMAAAEKATLATATAAQKLALQGAAFTSLGRTLTMFGTVVAAGVVVAIKAFADFDAQMSQVKTLSHATGGEMTQLAAAAETLGQKIGISATQAADAEIELVKAGVSVKDILGGALLGSLQLAAAGQIDVADATSIATIALTQFKLSGKDVPHVADLLAAGADKALGGVADLGEALKSGGLVAAQFGISLDDTIGVLSAFANAGLLGETAGTDLRQMLLKLADPSAQSAAEMQKLGLKIYDTSGQFVGLTNLAGQLHDKLGDATQATRNQALSVIFGSRAIAGANVLYAEGAKGIADWIGKVEDSGFAARQAAGKMNNLNGDISKLGAALQTDLIQAGSTANGVLRDVVQNLTDLVRGFSALPQPVQGTVLAVGAVVAVTALLGGGFLSLVPKIAATRVALVTLSEAAPALAAKMSALSTFLAGPWGVAIAASVLGVKLLSDYLDGLQASSSEITASLTGAKTAAELFATAGKGYLDADVAAQLEDLNKVLDAAAAKSANIFSDDLPYRSAEDALHKVGTQLALMSSTNAPAASAAFNLLAEKTDGSKKKLWELLSTMSDYRQELILEGLANGTYSETMSDAQKKTVLLAAAQGLSTDATMAAGGAYQSAATKAQNLVDQLSQLIDEFNKANGVGQDAVSQNAAYQKALADTSQSVKDYVAAHGKSAAALDESTVAGSANAAMLAGLAKKNEDAAKAQFDLDGNTTTYVATLQAGHDAVVANAEALGATADQAQAIADKVAGIPTQAEIAILVDTQQASQSIDDLMKKFNTLNGAAASAGARYAGLAAKYANMPGGGYASGGYTGNIPPASVAGVVHGREFVSTAATTANPSNRAALEYMHAGGVVRGYAGGGYVAPVYAQAPPPWASGGGQPHVGSTVPVNIKVTGETDPYAFAALAGQAVASRVRNQMR